MLDPSYKVIKWFTVIFFLGASFTRLIRGDVDQKLVCYYANWSIYRPGLAKFTPENIDPFLCTHLIYAFAGMNKDYELKPFDSYNDIQLGNYKKFTNLKSYNSKLKLLIAVGGWNEGSKRFSKMVESSSSRLRFVRGAVSFLRKHGFDGLDLDWEYPASREGGREEDKEGYRKLVEELREAFDSESRGSKSRLLLTMAVPAGKEYIDKGYDVPALSKSLDFFNLLTYDYHTSHEAQANHHAPLGEEPGLEEWHPNRQLNVEWTIKYYKKLGADPKKLVLGIPTYGRSFTLVDPDETELGAPSEGPGEKGNATREAGYLAYYEICQMIQDQDWELEAPYPNQMGPYAYKDNQWVGFDDEDIIIEKVKFIVRESLGGGMVWTLDNDDFRGKCYGEQSPLINTLKTALEEGRDLLKQKAAPLITTTQRSARQRTTKTTRKPSKTAPPFTTPDPGAPFECEDEGFFNNPTDCKKYFWCLDSGPSNLGLVAHSFTCPSGLFFNKARDSCDYAANVVCRVKKTTTVATTPRPKPRPRPRKTTTTTVSPKPDIPEEIQNSLDALKLPALNMSGKSLMELLDLIQQLGINQIHDKLQGRESNEATSTINPTLPQYRTPNRPTTTEEPTADLFNQYAKPSRTAKNHDEGTIKPRGPQYDVPAPEIIEDKERNEESKTTSSDKSQGFAFVYQTPSRHRTITTESDENLDDDLEDDSDYSSMKTTSARPKTTRPNRRVVVRVRPGVPGEGNPSERIPDEENKPENRRNYVLAQTIGVRRQVRPNILEETQTSKPPPMLRRAKPVTMRSTITTSVPQRRPSTTTRKELIVLPNGKPAVPATTKRYRQAFVEARGPSIALLPDGGVTCLRRGVYPHPKDCGKFLVCVPSVDGDEMDGFIHVCPEDTHFLESKGRCMPGDRSSCKLN